MVSHKFVHFEHVLHILELNLQKHVSLITTFAYELMIVQESIGYCCYSIVMII